MMDIEVVLAFQNRQYLVTLSLPEGTTIRQAAVAAFDRGLLPADNTGLDPETVPLGIYGELRDDNCILSEADRVEIYRPLLQDPKEWRRQRANRTKNSS